jgi:hypothetical protein
MSWRPQLLVYGLVVLALAGVPADRESRLDAYETRAQRALLYLEISTLARELERCEATFKTDCEMGAGLQLPRVCNRFAEALEGIARRCDELHAGRALSGTSRERFERSVQQPLNLARLELDLVEASALQVDELQQVQRRMREELRQGHAAGALSVFHAQHLDGIGEFGPQLVLNLLGELDELAFCAEYLQEPGLRDGRIY